MQPYESAIIDPVTVNPPEEQSEDCLFLNVAAPASALASKGTKLPVMVWLHGGGYMTDASNTYPIDFLVEASGHKVVVVSLNYRLGLFGFLASEKLAERSADGSTGNYGLHDQRLALAWVRQHVGAFGGDPGDITLFGESAGGNSILQHLVQPASFPLYDKVNFQEGTFRKEGREGRKDRKELSGGEEGRKEGHSPQEVFSFPFLPRNFTMPPALPTRQTTRSSCRAPKVT
jgi:carboxylesterase type B